MIEQPIFRSFAKNVMEAVESNNAELNSKDPLSRDRRAGLNKTVYDTDSTRPRQQNAQDRPPRSSYARPPMSRMTTNYDPQLPNDKYSADKLALIERLTRLAATDVEDLPGVGKVIKSTPRLLMKHRSPEELARLQKSVTRGMRRVEAPLERKLHKATAGIPAPLKKAVRTGGKALIRNPEQIPLQPVPVPGISPASLAGKKLMERAIDRFAPAAALSH